MEGQYWFTSSCYTLNTRLHIYNFRDLKTSKHCWKKKFDSPVKWNLSRSYLLEVKVLNCWSCRFHLFLSAPPHSLFPGPLCPQFAATHSPCIPLNKFFTCPASPIKCARRRHALQHREESEEGEGQGGRGTKLGDVGGETRGLREGN